MLPLQQVCLARRQLVAVPFALARDRARCSRFGLGGSSRDCGCRALRVGLCRAGLPDAVGVGLSASSSSLLSAWPPRSSSCAPLPCAFPLRASCVSRPPSSFLPASDLLALGSSASASSVLRIGTAGRRPAAGELLGDRIGLGGSGSCSGGVSRRLWLPARSVAEARHAAGGGRRLGLWLLGFLLGDLRLRLVLRLWRRVCSDSGSPCFSRVNSDGVISRDFDGRGFGRGSLASPGCE